MGAEQAFTDFHEAEPIGDFTRGWIENVPYRNRNKNLHITQLVRKSTYTNTRPPTLLRRDSIDDHGYSSTRITNKE